ncbi:hypothetical protein [Mesorhizobium sp. B2-3-12]|uniref:hypothetical protein n=1 Tax=Mesorhizobium sp. B2-3-12 TaxID=2589952 RepID=UPI00112CCDE4|nr:hypothetical protein [Mesorhizobium sp. B2-3-12]TPL88658.1 hypothetical protein FJ948_20785 [Mesorhizobium sp. B2-3-12]
MISTDSEARSKGFLDLAPFVGAVLALPTGAALLVAYPGASPLALLCFYASGCIAVALSLVYPSSFFVFFLSSFLFVGFIAKAVANLVFDVKLIEPISGFTSEWDQALLFAASGLFGVCLANIVAGFYPSFRNTLRASGPPRLAHFVLGALALLTIVSVALYWGNYSFHIIRIGFPLGVPMDGRIYAVAAFVISWGALLGGLTAVLWLIELRGWPYAALIYMATLLGALASLSMGSRIQLLLYVLAACAVVMLRHRQVQSWIAVTIAMGLAALVFAGSLAVVSFERAFDFSLNAPPIATPSVQHTPQTASDPMQLPAPAMNNEASNSPGQSKPDTNSSAIAAPPSATITSPAPEAPSLADKVETVTRDRFALEGLFRQLRNLAIMRWVGMEGVMTAAANSNQLSTDLFFKVLSEDPAEGSHAIYQKMSGDRYGNVEYYTFLTLPGPVGIASLSGSLPVVAAFMFALTLVGHSIEWVASRATQNIATAAVAGVSLAYLTVQMGFPWTLLIYAIELVLSVLFLGAIWWLTKGLTARGVRAG